MSDLKPCDCGKPVRIRAMPITVNRKRGVTHWLQHDDFSELCVSGDWSAVMFKPYPKDDTQKPKQKMFDEWNTRENLAALEDKE